MDIRVFCFERIYNIMGNFIIVIFLGEVIIYVRRNFLNWLGEVCFYRILDYKLFLNLV